jgi:hypothetical protein
LAVERPLLAQVAGLLAAVRFRTKPEIALEQIRQAAAEGVPLAVLLARAACCHLDRHAARPLGAGAGSGTAPMPALPPPRRAQLDKRRAFATQ